MLRHPPVQLPQPLTNRTRRSRLPQLPINRWATLISPPPRSPVPDWILPSPVPTVRLLKSRERPPIRRSKYGEPEPRPLPPVKVVTVPTTLPHRLPRPSPWVTSTYRPTPSPEFGSGWMLIISTEMPPQTRWQTVRQSLSGLTSRATPIMPDRERRMPNPPMPPVPSIIWEWSVSPQPRVWTSPRVMIFRL